MSVRQSWTAPIPPFMYLAGAAYANSTTATDVNLSATTTTPVVLPANFLDVGTTLILKAFGVFSTTGTPTLKLGFSYGGANGGVSLCDTGAITTGSGVTNVPWRIEATVHIRSLGTSGVAIGQGFCAFGTSVSATNFLPMPNTALATVTIDTTAAKQISAAATWGTPSASNTLTCHGFTCLVAG